MNRLELAENAKALLLIGDELGSRGESGLQLLELARIDERLRDEVGQQGIRCIPCDRRRLLAQHGLEVFDLP